MTDITESRSSQKLGDDAESEQKLTDDLVWGTQAIADTIGRSLVETQYLIRKKKLPIGRLGPKLLFASKRQLRRHLTPRAT
jgi:hypothetical protein